MKRGKNKTFYQGAYNKETCPLCNKRFRPGEIDDHIAECDEILTVSVGSLGDLAELEERGDTAGVRLQDAKRLEWADRVIGKL